MAFLIREEDLESIASPELALRALREAMTFEAEGQTTVPPRVTVPAPGGWLRLMPATVGPSNGGVGTLGFKAMNLNDRDGVRYMILLYEAGGGELIAIMDARRITRVRTAAVTALAAEALVASPPAEIGLFGSGGEATSHLEALKSLWPELARVRVYSPRRERRESFAARMSEELDVDVGAVDEPQEAAAAPVVVLATKDTQPVAMSEWLQPGTVVLSIGSTRLDLRELDEQIFARSEWCLCDSPMQVAAESGDVKAALDAGHLVADQLIRLADVVTGARVLARPSTDLSVFKSVGTALQDIAVGAAVFQECRERGDGVDLGEFPTRK